MIFGWVMILQGFFVGAVHDFFAGHNFSIADQLISQLEVLRSVQTFAWVCKRVLSIYLWENFKMV